MNVSKMALGVDNFSVIARLIPWNHSVRIVPHRSAIEFRCHAIAKIYPIDRCRVRITPIATISSTATNDATGQHQMRTRTRGAAGMRKSAHPYTIVEGDRFLYGAWVRNRWFELPEIFFLRGNVRCTHCPSHPHRWGALSARCPECDTSFVRLRSVDFTLDLF
jgi:hypothetical protein